MQLGGKKTAVGSKALSAEDASWGAGNDLMDVNADEGDRTAFESAPTGATGSLAPSASALGFGDVTGFNTPVLNIDGRRVFVPLIILDFC